MKMNQTEDDHSLTLVVHFDEELTEFYSKELFLVSDIASAHNQRLPETVGVEVHLNIDNLDQYIEISKNGLFFKNATNLLIYFENDIKGKFTPLHSMCLLLQELPSLKRLTIWLDSTYTDLEKTFFFPLYHCINRLNRLLRLELNFRSSSNDPDIGHTFPLHPVMSHLQWLTLGCFSNNITGLLRTANPSKLYHLSIYLDNERFLKLLEWTRNNLTKVQGITELEIKMAGNEEPGNAVIRDFASLIPNLTSFRYEQKYPSKYRCIDSFATIFSNRRLKEITLIGIKLICTHFNLPSVVSVTKVTIVMPPNRDFFEDLLQYTPFETNLRIKYLRVLNTIFRVFPNIQKLDLIGHCKEPCKSRYYTELAFRKLVLTFRPHVQMSISFVQMPNCHRDSEDEKED